MTLAALKRRRRASLSVLALGAVMFALCATLGGALSGCGLKGPLYLPQQKKSKVPPTPSNPAPDEPAAEPDATPGSSSPGSSPSDTPPAGAPASSSDSTPHE
jgi:predicted small lipoprotein YifL